MAHLDIPPPPTTVCSDSIAAIAGNVQIAARLAENLRILTERAAKQNKPLKSFASDEFIDVSVGVLLGRLYAIDRACDSLRKAWCEVRIPDPSPEKKKTDRKG